MTPLFALSTASVILIVLLGLAALALLFGVGIYNSLVTLRNRYRNAFSQIDVQLKRRNDLIPNLVEVAKGYMGHERETLEAVVQARNAAVNAQQRAANNPGDPSAMSSLAAAEGQLGGTLGRLFALAEAHKDTPMVGRTHAVQALPITFGHKCAIWLAEAQRNHDRLALSAARNFVSGMTGAVGTQASFGVQAFALDRMLMGRLGLGVADIAWQVARDRLADYANALGLIGGALAKIAHEIIILSHNEIDEVAEPFDHGKVGSSTMPHKRNPVICEGVLAVGRALRASVGLMQEALVVEHERDASTWRLEWKAMPECCLMTGAMLAQMKHVLGGLEVHADQMRRNLDTLGGFLMSERVMFALADKVGKQSAHELVYEVAMRGIDQGITFEQALTADARVQKALGATELRVLLDPTTYVGLAPEIVDRVLAETKAAGWLT